MHLPDLSALSVGKTRKQALDRELIRERQRWLVACGHHGQIPNLKSWNSMGAKDKWELVHSVANDADGYVTPYLELPIAVVLEDGTRTVEHVLPRITVNGKHGGKAENDYNGFAVAEERANARRGSLQLLLWPIGSELKQEGTSFTVPISGYTVYLQGEKHFVPPLSQRARLARKWLFLRACYSTEDSISPPSAAQIANKNLIISMCKTQPVFEYEREVNQTYRERYGWANPLLEDGAHTWYDSQAWRKLCFPSP